MITPVIMLVVDQDQYMEAEALTVTKCNTCASSGGRE